MRYNLYFDKEGIVVESSSEEIEGIPRIKGIAFDNVELYKKLPVEEEDVFKKIGDLSGGERGRVSLAKLMLSPANFLILDEPTNDLDIYTQMKLETFLEQYQGCLMVVSHDRHFLDRIVSQLFVFKPEGKIKEFPGNYSDYLIKEKEENKQKKLSEEKTDKPIVTKRKDSQTKIKLTYKEQKEKESIEELLPILEERKQTIEQQLSSGELTNELLLSTTQEYQALIEEINQKEERWLELCSKEQE